MDPLRRALHKVNIKSDVTPPLYSTLPPEPWTSLMNLRGHADMFPDGDSVLVMVDLGRTERRSPNSGVYTDL